MYKYAVWMSSWVALDHVCMFKYVTLFPYYVMLCINMQHQWLIGWHYYVTACESTLSNMTTSMYNGMYTNTTSPYTNMTYTGDLYTCEAGKSVALNLGYTHVSEIMWG